MVRLGQDLIFFFAQRGSSNHSAMWIFFPLIDSSLIYVFYGCLDDINSLYDVSFYLFCREKLIYKVL